MIDGALSARTGLGDGGGERVSAASRGAGRWRDWFAPAQGLWPQLVDGLLAVALAFVQIVGTILYSQDEANRWAFDAVACIPLAAGPVALLFRRRWPEATLVVAFVAAAGYAATGYPRGPAGFPAFAFALVSAIMMGRRTFAWAVLVVAYPAFTLLPSLVPDDVERARSLASTAANLVWLPLVGAAGEIARIRVERQAEQAHMAQEEARRRASQERLLIARELHDVLAHNISLINVQSGVALHLLDERPEQIRPALAAINEASEEALGELRSVLDVLSRGLDDGGPEGGPRVPGGPGMPGEDGADDESGAWAPRAPMAGLRDLDGLLRRTRSAGLDVRLTVEGEARPVPAEVDLAAFRILQEALTNVVRHAGGAARATVRLVYAPAELVVQVDDDGQGASPLRDRPGAPRAGGAGAGRGIAGMRERVDALGGTFAAGPRPGRGFRIRARLPARGGA